MNASSLRCKADSKPRKIKNTVQDEISRDARFRVLDGVLEQNGFKIRGANLKSHPACFTKRL
jgi:hypothetical protein